MQGELDIGLTLNPFPKAIVWTQVLSGNRLMTRRVYRFVEEINEKILSRTCGTILKPQFNARLAGEG